MTRSIIRPSLPLGFFYAEEKNELLSYFKTLLCAKVSVSTQLNLTHTCLLTLQFTPSLSHCPMCWMAESNFRQISRPTKIMTIKDIWSKLGQMKKFLKGLSGPQDPILVHLAM